MVGESNAVKREQIEHAKKVTTAEVREEKFSPVHWALAPETIAEILVNVMECLLFAVEKIEDKPVNQELIAFVMEKLSQAHRATLNHVTTEKLKVQEDLVGDSIDRLILNNSLFFKIRLNIFESKVVLTTTLS